jgi:hypothetical protein
VPDIKPGRPSVEERVNALMHQLDSLLEGAEAAARLVACGSAAVGPLREFLIEGRPRGVFQPRLWVVQALGGLGADDVLLEYLRRPIASSDPVVRFAEQTVRSAAAKALARSEVPGVHEALFGVACDERLPGALEAIADRDPEAATPFLIAALEDDFARDAAQAGLRRRGADVRDALIDAALDAGSGSEAALRRRRAALDLLREIGIDAEAWRRLECLLGDADAQLVCAVSLVGVQHSPDPGRIVRRLLEISPEVGWEWLETLEDVVVDCAIRAGHQFPLLLPLGPTADHRLDAFLTWRRICRRVAAAKERQ